MNVIFSEFAHLEFNDAIHYYEIEHPGLGRQFREEVKNAAKRIMEYPKAWSVEREEVRSAFSTDFRISFFIPLKKITSLSSLQPISIENRMIGLQETTYLKISETYQNSNHH